MIYDSEGTKPEASFPDKYRFRLADAGMNGRLQEITYQEAEGSCQIHWRPIRPIPEEDA